jgi:hypothetical protein
VVRAHAICTASTTGKVPTTDLTHLREVATKDGLRRAINPASLSPYSYVYYSVHIFFA